MERHTLLLTWECCNSNQTPLHKTGLLELGEEAAWCDGKIMGFGFKTQVQHAYSLYRLGQVHTFPEANHRIPAIDKTMQRTELPSV